MPSSLSVRGVWRGWCWQFQTDLMLLRSLPVWSLSISRLYKLCPKGREDSCTSQMPLPHTCLYTTHASTPHMPLRMPQHVIEETMSFKSKSVHKSQLKTLTQLVSCASYHVLSEQRPLSEWSENIGSGKSQWPSYSTTHHQCFLSLLSGNVFSERPM